MPLMYMCGDSICIHTGGGGNIDFGASVYCREWHDLCKTVYIHEYTSEHSSRNNRGVGG